MEDLFSEGFCAWFGVEQSSKIVGKWRGRQWKVVSGEPSTDLEKDWALLDVGVGIHSEGDSMIYMSGGFSRDRQVYAANHLIRWPAK